VIKANEAIKKCPQGGGLSDHALRLCSSSLKRENLCPSPNIIPEGLHQVLTIFYPGMFPLNRKVFDVGANLVFAPT